MKSPSPKTRPKSSRAATAGLNGIAKLNKYQRRRRNKKLRKATLQQINVAKRTITTMGFIIAQVSPKFSLGTAAEPNDVVKLNKSQRHRRNKKLRKAATQKCNAMKRIVSNASKVIGSVKDMTTMGFMNVHRLFRRRHFRIPETSASPTLHSDTVKRLTSNAK